MCCFVSGSAGPRIYFAGHKASRTASKPPKIGGTLATGHNAKVENVECKFRKNCGRSLMLCDVRL
jgi:hypothetical protein